MVPLGTVAGAVAPGAGKTQRLHASAVPWGSHWGGDSETWVNPEALSLGWWLLQLCPKSGRALRFSPARGGAAGATRSVTTESLERCWARLGSKRE